ncbi:MAG: hypothetical protein ACON4H_01245 [Rubripirellula sp.]
MSAFKYVAKKANREPTPEQIQKRAARIRKRWSRRTEQRRRVGNRTQWIVPNIDLTEFDFQLCCAS